MTITDRKVAIAHNLKTYFTGKPCKNGHLAPRYTKSGACQICVNGEPGTHTVEAKEAAAAAMVDKNAKLAAAIAEREATQQREAARSEHKNNVTKLKFVVPDRDWPDFRAVVIAVTQSTFPELTDDDIAPSKLRKPNSGVGLGLYTVMCQISDKAMFDQISTEMRDTRWAETHAANLISTSRPAGSLSKDDILLYFTYEGGLLMPKNPADVKWDGLYRGINGHWYKYDDLYITVTNSMRMSFCKPCVLPEDTTEEHMIHYPDRIA